MSASSRGSSGFSASVRVGHLHSPNGGEPMADQRESSSPETLQRVLTEGVPLGRWKEGQLLQGINPTPGLTSAANWCGHRSERRVTGPSVLDASRKAYAARGIPASTLTQRHGLHHQAFRRTQRTGKRTTPPGRHPDQPNPHHPPSCGKMRASTAHLLTNGPAHAFTATTLNAARPSWPGYTPITSTAAASHSAVNHPPAAYLISQVSTPSLR